MSADEHLSQVVLIQLLDGELDEQAASKARSHLGGCEACRAALSETRMLVKELESIKFSREPRADGARSTLKEKLLEAREARAGSFSLVAPVLAALRRFPVSFYGASAAAALIALIFLLAPDFYRSVAETSVSLPNRALTPGMTRPVNVDEMCSAGNDDLDPVVPAATRQTVYREYGISMDHSGSDFQVDYLISPQLGGTNDVRNLWPQSYGATMWNAVAKDRLERHLYRLVCDKKINLADAQRDIATNWIAAYQKYFQTRHPA